MDSLAILKNCNKSKKKKHSYFPCLLAPVEPFFFQLPKMCKKVKQKPDCLEMKTVKIASFLHLVFTLLPKM
jgi:hypothetical protein